MTTEQYRIEKHKYGWLIYGSAIPVDDFTEICKLAGKRGVMSPGIASAMSAHTALCANDSNEKAWREEIEASLTAGGKIYTPQMWRNGTDTGLSSIAIYSVMTNSIDPNDRWRGRTPADSADFGRCYRLLKKFPDWIPRLPEVAAAYPQTEWPMIIKDWADLTARFEANDHEGIYETLCTIHEQHQINKKQS